MLISDYYSLTYTANDLPQHILLQIAGIKHKALEAGSATNVKLAEWMLSKIEYESKDLLRQQTSLGTITKKQASAIGSYLKHIHSNCRDEIEGKFAKPLLSDEEVGEIFLDVMVADCLDDISNGTAASYETIQERFGTGNGILRIECGKKVPQANSKDARSNREYDEFALARLLTEPW